MAKNVIMICEDCLSRNYKSKINQYRTERLELKKYCPKCRKATLHKETR